MSTYWVLLPWVKPPLSLNDSHGNRYAKAAKVAMIRDAVHRLAIGHDLPHKVSHCTVQMHYRPRDNRRRDTDNLVATLKPACDALAVGTVKHPGYGLVLDDTPEYMSKPEPIIHKAIKGVLGAMWLEIMIDGPDLVQTTLNPVDL